MSTSKLSVITENGHGSMVTAIAMGWPAQVFDLLAKGLCANNELGSHSYLTFSMFHHARDESPARASIALLLADHGATIDHRPLNAGQHASTQSRADLWQNSEFGASVMFHAMAYALRHNRAAPRLRTGDMPFDGQLLADREHTRLHLENPTCWQDVFAEHLNLPKIHQTLKGVEAVQDEVGLRLHVPGDETERYVTATLPEHEKVFWNNPNTDPLGRALRLSGLKH